MPNKGINKIEVFENIFKLLFLHSNMYDDQVNSFQQSK